MRANLGNPKMPTEPQETPTETLTLRSAAGASQPTFRLTVTGGDDVGKTFVVDGTRAGRVYIGTGPTADFRLSDRSVSRRHLALWLEDGALAFEDLGSTNGTRVGTLRVSAARLEGGETLCLASAVLRVEALADPAVVVVARKASFGRLLGASVAMRRLYGPLADLAQRDVPVLIEGEAGTGKELTAEVLHEEGPRRHNELVVFDPSVMAPERVDAELFGSAQVPGAFERCPGGTLVIDEPSALPTLVQAKLARLLESRSVSRSDGTTLALGDVRVIALSRSDVERDVFEGRLHEGLAAVMGGARIELPPLRERTGDVTLLATAFFRALELEDAALAPLTLRRFEAYSWPGNVRELKKAVARAAFTKDQTTDPLDAFRGEGRAASATELFDRVLGADLALPAARAIIVEDFERRFVERVLDRSGGNVTRAAAASGLARRYFQLLRSKHGV